MDALRKIVDQMPKSLVLHEAWNTSDSISQTMYIS